MFTILYDAQGNVVPYEEFRKATHRDDINVAMGDLRRYLAKNHVNEIAKSIKNSRMVGYWLKFDKLPGSRKESNGVQE